MDDKKTLWHGILIFNIAVILFYWWQGSSHLLTSGIEGILIAFGRLAGLSAAFTVLLQFVFMGRSPWLERAFGLNKLSQIHHTNGKLSLFFLIAHPFLLTVGYSRLANVGLWTQYKTFLFDFEHVIFAVVALTLFLAVVVSSLVIIRQKFRYESWYFVHLLVYLAVFFSFWHQIALGGTLLSSRVFYGYWITLYAVVLTSHVLFRFLSPLYMSYRHRFTLEKIERENYNTVSLYISGRDLGKFNIYPGQFMILRFLAKGFWWQAHPFSLSKLPDGNSLRITVKELGDFTGRVKSIPLGAKLIIDGPYGVFTEWVARSSKILFIAGGIGITPIRSLIEKMVGKQKDVVLLYANKTEKDIVFKEELERLHVKVTHVLSDQSEYSGEKGVLDNEKISRLVSDVADRDVYICGPPRMIDAMIDLLKNMGVPLSRIHHEKFSL